MNKKEIFNCLESWVKNKKSYSLHNFCKPYCIAISDLEKMAEESEEFLQIYDSARSKIFDNLYEGLASKELSKHHLETYLIEFGYENPGKMIESFELDIDAEERDKLVKDMENRKKDPEKAFLAATTILNKYGHRRGYK